MTSELRLRAWLPSYLFQMKGSGHRLLGVTPATPVTVVVVVLILFTYLWLRWVFVAVRRLLIGVASLVAEHRL